MNKSIQTHSTRGDFKGGDAHPTEAGLVFWQYLTERNGEVREYWVTPEEMLIRRGKATDKQAAYYQRKKEKNPPKTLQIVCSTCKKTFDANNRTRKYCSVECRPVFIRPEYSQGRVAGMGSLYWDDEDPFES